MDGVPVPQLDLILDEDPAKTKGLTGVPSSAAFGVFLSPMLNSNAPAGLPLIVKMPDGGKKQLDVPPTATVRDLKTKVLKETAAATPGLTMETIDMSFGEAGLMDDDALLSAYHIPSAYENAGSLLWTIDESQLNHERKVAAVGVAADVIKGITSGVDTTERLIPTHEPRAGLPPLPPVTGQPTAIAPNNNVNPYDRGPTAPPGKPNSSFTTPVPGQILPKEATFQTQATLLAPGSARISPSDLLPKLSGKMPSLFTPEATETWASAYKLGTPVPPPSAGWRSNPLAAGVPQPLGSIARAQSDAPAAQQQANWLDEIAQTWEAEREKVYPPAQPDRDEDESGADDWDDEEGSGHEENGEESTERSLASGADADNNLSPDQKPLLVPSKKKRGRKRKYPNMSEEERKEMRKQQNRESARKSRAKKREISAEYDGRMEVLKKQNDHLKDEVGDLKQRLAFLQQLLTVSVRQSST